MESHLLEHDGCGGQRGAVPLGASGQQESGLSPGIAHAEGEDGRLHVSVSTDDMEGNDS